MRRSRPRQLHRHNSRGFRWHIHTGSYIVTTSKDSADTQDRYIHNGSIVCLCLSGETENKVKLHLLLLKKENCRLRKNEGSQLDTTDFPHPRILRAHQVSLLSTLEGLYWDSNREQGSSPSDQRGQISSAAICSIVAGHSPTLLYPCHWTSSLESQSFR